MEFKYYVNRKPPAGLSPFPAGFRPTNKSPPFRHKLANKINITIIDLFCALLETGYGLITKKNPLKLTPKELNDLATFLKLRARWILSTVESPPPYNSTLRFKSLYKIIESTDRGTISTILGLAGSNLAIKNWLPTSAVPYKKFFHVRTFSNAHFVTKDHVITLIKRSDTELIPDFICQDNQDNWHVIEAKSGGTSYKNEAIQKGLKQLDAILGVQCFNNPNKQTLKSSICSFLEYPPGSDWKLTIVDPEGSENTLLINAEAAILRAAIFQAKIIFHIEKNDDTWNITPNGYQLKIPKDLRSLIEEIGSAIKNYDHIEQWIITRRSKKTLENKSKFTLMITNLLDQDGNNLHKKNLRDLIEDWEKPSGEKIDEIRLNALKKISEKLKLTDYANKLYALRENVALLATIDNIEIDVLTCGAFITRENIKQPKPSLPSRVIRKL